MNFIRLSSTLCAAASAFCLGSAHAQTGTDLIKNGGFEYMTTGLAAGNNIGTVPNGWTVSSGTSNLQQGPAAGTNAGTQLAPYNGAYSGAAAVSTTGFNTNTDTGGTHFFDGTQDVNNFTVISQTFTLSRTTTLTGSFALGARDEANGAFVAGEGQKGSLSGATANAGTSFVQILTSTGTPVPITVGGASVTTYYGDTSQVGIGQWEVNPFTVANLAAGTYTFQVSLYGSQNLDAVALVPEPSAAVMAASGFGLLLLVQRLRRRAS